MCGIAGIFYLGQAGSITPTAATTAALARMNQAQVHRGPDDEGLWLSADGRVALGQRRLAIIDLSPAGHQPMANEDGSIWLTYNGEIYNFQELRRELEALGHTFRSHTDTEVVLHAHEQWGVDAFPRFRGMFAFALWDGPRQTLYLVKDRFGIKPLYYYLDREKLVFASETRALAASGLFPRELNPAALIAFLLWGSVPVPLTTIKGVQSLPAGHYLVLRQGRVRLERYYDLWTDGGEPPDPCQPDNLRALLAETVGLHLISDAPLGVFLSGGIDSSSLVALAALARQDRLTTLSINFEEAEFSEEPYQRLVAEKYHTDHRVLTLTRRRFLEDLPRALAAMDQPSIDGLNTWFVSRLAREAGLKAVLSGTGGDELFCGYPHFQRAGLLTRLAALGSLFRGLDGVLPPLPGRLRKLPFLALHRNLGWYGAIRGLFTPMEVARLTGAAYGEVMAVADSLAPEPPPRSPVDLLSRYELNFYLQNQLLKDTDVMSMAHSLETRVPFLDPVLVQTVLGSPPAARVNGRVPKVLLTGALGDLLPPEIVYRPKMTFTFPFATWLRNWPSWKAALHGPLNRQAGAAILNDYHSGRLSWSRPWALLVAQTMETAAPLNAVAAIP
jgi:asparagine synthase (glutamine-hydrolysing)